ncbi:MAG: metal-dependent transcriptional regulator [Faecalibacterium sp.]
MNIHESSEDYLEAILRLGERNGHVRSVDIANDLNYTKASVSRAMKLLRTDAYIEVDEGGNIILTEKGYAIASRIYARHKHLTDFFIQIGVSPETAAADACKIEHDLSDESYQKLLMHACRK